MFDLPKVTKYSVEQFELCEGKVKLVVAISLLKMKKPAKHDYQNVFWISSYTFYIPSFVQTKKICAWVSDENYKRVTWGMMAGNSGAEEW